MDPLGLITNHASYDELSFFILVISTQEEEHDKL